MSATGPNCYAVIGDVDHLSTSLRGAGMYYDSTLRVVRMLVVSTWQSALGASTRRCGPVPLYAEAIAPNHPHTMFGLVADSLAASVTGSWMANCANAAAMREGNIYHNVATAQTGLAAYGGEIRVGLKLYYDGATPKVQFYKNGASYGTALTLASDTAFRIGVSLTNAGNQMALALDGPDMIYLPADCQPWGVAARVSDVGGYSPRASRLRAVTAVPAAVDVFGRTVTAATNGTANNASGDTRAWPSTYSGLVYCEFAYEVHDASDAIIGLARATDTAYTYVGGNTTTWGYSRGGLGWHNNAFTSLGVTWATAGARPGFILQPSTGKLWWTTAGVPVAGNPEAGTGATYTNVLGPVVPACSLWSTAAGRIRLCSHAREQMHRPAYCDALDGPDLLPEQHFDGAITTMPEVERSIHYALLWGNRASRDRESTIGIGNAGGAYDALSMYSLRNQAAGLYDTDADGVLFKEASLICERLALEHESLVNVVLRTPDAKLDVRVDKPIVSFGPVAFAPAVARQGATLTYDIAHTQLCTFAHLFDGGGSVQSWTRVPVATNDETQACAIKRTVAPDKRHAVSELSTFYKVADVMLVNGNLNAWTGSTPTSWTKTEVGTGTIAAAASNTAARIQGAGNTTNYAAIHQTATGFAGGTYADPGYTYFVGVNITTNTSGDLDLALEEFAGAYPAGAAGQYVVATAKVAGAGTGWVWIGLPNVAGSTLNILSIYASRSAGTAVDITITDVSLIEASSTTTPKYVLGKLGGFAPSAWKALGQDQATVDAALAGYSFAVWADWSDQRPTIGQLLQRYCDSRFGDWFVDANGVITGAYLTEPEAWSTMAANYKGLLTVNDVAADGRLSVRDDNAPGLSDRAHYNACFALHTDTDFNSGASSSIRALLQAPALELRLATPGAGAGDAKAFHPFFAAALGAPPMARWTRGYSANYASTTGTDPANVNTDDDLVRVHRYAGVRRRFYTVPIQFAAFRARRANPGDVVTFRFPRFGLAQGRQLQVLSYVRRLGSPVCTLTLLG